MQQDGSPLDEPGNLARNLRLSWSSLNRHRLQIAAALAGATGLAVLFLAARPDAYTAAARILVDNRVLALTQQDAIYSVSSVSNQLIESQVQILRSENILKRVIAGLDLLKDRDFGAPGRTFLSAPDASAAPLPEDGHSALRRALDKFQKRLAVEQVGHSDVIEIRMTARDPQLAAEIANRLVAEYLNDQQTANASAAQSSSGWLRNYVSSLGTTARVITAATPPLLRDGPGAPLILAFAAFCGLGAGAAVAFGRDALGWTVKTPAELRAACGGVCTAVLPAIEARGSVRSVWRRTGAPPEPSRVIEPVPALEWAAARPDSLFAHSLRRVRAALLETPSPSGGLIIGVTSVLPGEGKTLAAANLARIAAATGRNVLLVDAVPYNAQLTKLLAPRAGSGLREALHGAPLAGLVLRDPVTGMHFLSGFTGPVRTGLATPAGEKLLAMIRAQYGLAIIDMPPLPPVSDVHEAAALFDKFVLVAGWGERTADELAQALAAAPAIRARLAAALLNKASLPALRKYGMAPEAAWAGSSGYINDNPASVHRPWPEPWPERADPIWREKLPDKPAAPRTVTTAVARLWQDGKAPMPVKSGSNGNV